MIKIGDTVRNVSANVVGVVVEIDGGMVYLEQSNGCEVDFAAASLVLEEAYQAKHDTSVRSDAGSHENDAAYEAVIVNLYPAIIEIGQRSHADTKPIPGVAAKSWGELSALQQLNVISSATDVPIKSWLDANRVGAKPSLAELQLSALAAVNQDK